MTEEKQPTVTVQSVVRVPEHRTIYVNGCRGGVSQWDVHLVFARTSESAPGVPNMEEHATLVMSPSFAKALIGIVTASVDTYEKLFGPVIYKEAHQPSQVDLKELAVLGSKAEKK